MERRSQGCTESVLRFVQWLFKHSRAAKPYVNERKMKYCWSNPHTFQYIHWQAADIPHRKSRFSVEWGTLECPTQGQKAKITENILIVSARNLVS